MGTFFAELKRRHIYRVAAAYVVVAWVLIQLVNNIAPLLKLPDWLGPAVLVLLLVGLPVVMIFAWTHELKSGQAPTRTGGIDYILVFALILVIGIFGYQQFAAVPSTNATQTTLTPVSPANGGISIAVLPFANVSGDATQEFFSDGMTDEIIAALAKVKDLRVVARTSAFQFKGQNRDIQAIGGALHASHIIEGSVRKAGDRVRITAQLVQVGNGVSVWADSYDREIKDVFAVQEDIAKSIALSLRVPLGLQQGQQLVSNRGIDPETYQQFLRAKALFRQRNFVPAIQALEQVVAQDANYAPAWAQLAQAYGNAALVDTRLTSGSAELARRAVADWMGKEEAAVNRAMQLDANQPDVLAALGQLQVRRSKLTVADDLYAKALTIDPSNTDAMYYRANLLAGVGRLKNGLALINVVLEIEPLVPIYTAVGAVHLWLDGQNDAAIAMRRNAGSDPVMLARFFGQVYASQGRYDEAADLLAQFPVEYLTPGVHDQLVGLMRSAPKPAPSPQTLPRLGYLGFAYLHVGAPERFFEYFEDSVKDNYAAAIFYAAFWHPSATALRKTDRFKTFIRNAGILDYWRAKGWPDMCHPTIGDDFECS